MTPLSQVVEITLVTKEWITYCLYTTTLPSFTRCKMPSVSKTKQQKATLTFSREFFLSSQIQMIDHCIAEGEAIPPS